LLRATDVGQLLDEICNNFNQLFGACIRFQTKIKDKRFHFPKLSADDALHFGILFPPEAERLGLDI